MVNSNYKGSTINNLMKENKINNIDMKKEATLITYNDCSSGKLCGFFLYIFKRV